MTGHWMTQTAAAIFGAYLLVAVAVAAAIVAAIVAVVLPVARRRHIRRSQVLITRIAMAAWFPPSALNSPEGGQSTDGAGTPDPAPSVAPTIRFRVSYDGRRRMVA